ncbi:MULTISPECIES: MarR family winged helix-turn-helix transcriptional regulator [unclassified Nocardioides]|uniref:MarR family winged helix-turn-helix transcriptional regulator n=1 Tax=unclassified Nocardioides TaxID=2615069 RepID=UPI0006F6C5BC|nr:MULTISPECIES: MarR family transcriptional regulator [unclassified Nocardioides]KQY50997.1 MarR family transcriptional regulator [Nocardioides sp. Root140]KQZ76284.1 MarR family transcriptional regulator [Nocardioides sp. Root151]KRF15215.1 MarR family transcriptional regulator [Nocardioides sp. Soil796]
MKSSSDGVADIIEQWAAVRPELDVSAMSVFGPLHRSFLLYRAQISAIFESYGTNEAGFDVLASLRRAAPEHRRTAGELAAQTLVTTGGLTLRVNRLQEAGLVQRQRDGVDNRVVYVTLTEAGRRLIDEVADAHFANEQRMLAGLTNKQRTNLSALLGELESSLRAVVQLGPDGEVKDSA